ncbi:MAG TPA: phenylalanine--tRNA ligase subunit beta [Rhodanobacteraceae bacterium]|nr:phenylalanine--tRNA ligase subunit beta [Rhodanobacteraceae bacterium]
MRFSENWLRSLVEIPAGRAGLVERLTLGGLEVESVEVLGAQLDRVIVARIIECTPHPDADKLRVCRVETGSGEVQIVCGAPNARAGLKAPLATIGAQLPNGVAIKAAKLRGVESQGMLCSAKELALDADASGLMELPDDAPVGATLGAYLGLPDASIELKLTPNRSDCLGMRGLADEVAAEFGTHAKGFDFAAVAATIRTQRAIRLEAGADCPRYFGRAIRGLNPAAKTPVWVAQRLRAAGIKPISAVVDVTQYVMLELGQPLHAFDESMLDGAIIVRRARAGESLKLLEGSEAKLDAGFLVIADEQKPLALAGVMGGFDSRVTDTTRDVFLESAHFAPAAIMGRARKLGLNTDAAHRFERGVDPDLPRLAMERATALLVEIAGGQAGDIVEAALPECLSQTASIALRRARIARVLGVVIADDQVQRILSALGMRLESAEHGWRVTPPSRRFDIQREEDLIEELARIHGYAQIPSRLPAGEPPAPVEDEARLPESALRAQLAARDFNEAVCYAFVDAQRLQTWGLAQGAVPLANPLSAELAVMRTSLLPGLVDALIANRRRQQTRVRLFECGRVFRGPGPGTPDPGGSQLAGDRSVAGKLAPPESPMLAAVACGSAVAEQWGGKARALDFFDLKGDLESLLDMGGSQAWSFDRKALPVWLHPGRGARILHEGRPVGAMGALHPRLLRELDLDSDVYALEIQAEPLRRRELPQVAALPRFPSVRRDIAVELPLTVAWAEIEGNLRKALGSVLADTFVFDVYTGPGLKSDQKSVAMGLILQDRSRTLTDQDADRCVAAALASLETMFGAKLRS